MDENQPTKDLSEFQKIILKDLLDRRSANEQNLLQGWRTAGIGLSIFVGFTFDNKYFEAPTVNAVALRETAVAGVLIGFTHYLYMLRSQNERLTVELEDFLRTLGSSMVVNRDLHRYTWHLRWITLLAGLYILYESYRLFHPK